MKKGRVVGRGWTKEGGRPHAEAAALAQAGPQAADATVYVTLEPCAHDSDRGPACSDSLVDARVAKVKVGCIDPDPRTAGKGIERLRASGIETSLIETDKTTSSLSGYLARTSYGRPYVTLKLALSLDGCIAMPDGSSQWITGDAARAHVHSRRAMSDAILVGGGTWRYDKPGLDVRLEGLEHRSPQRILLTRGVAPDGVKVINAPEQIARLDGVQYLYIEGGAGAAASFLAADLVDRLEVYRAPILIGSGRSALSDIGLSELAEAHGRWTLDETRQLGSDTFCAYRRTRQET